MGYTLVYKDQNVSTGNSVCEPPVPNPSDDKENKIITIVAVFFGVVMLVVLVGIVAYGLWKFCWKRRVVN